MRLLLTGATGFVGRNALLHAIARGDEVHVPVRDPAKLSAQLRKEGAASARVTPLSTDPSQWACHDFDQAILGAGVLFARTPAEYHATNVDWTLAVLRALPPACRTVILSSQSAGGPTPPGAAARSETHEDRPITWYGESKLAMERAVRAGFSGRRIAILRPPMILGARDTATLPLFRMAQKGIRIKPGLRDKSFSFIAVDDLVAAVFTALEQEPPDGPRYIASRTTITDRELIAAAAAAVGKGGITVPVPQAAVRCLALLVDAVPALRARTPSLTRDRAREIWPDRWVVDGSAFATQTGWRAHTALDQCMAEACAHYVREGAL
ncbi:MAG TPA: NAD(P)-dependent oxidoreductase [Terrimicrobiaceae bacterium]|nr:NAD(P)-dependent oxidoreductase [Terrimicrobiaceae bacterium]